MKKVCFVPVDDHLFASLGGSTMVNSFKLFHPDVELIIFGSATTEKLFREKGINWYQAKPYFAELLEDKYDLIVNMDVDHVITGRMTEVFDNVDYDVALPSNFNDFYNISIDNVTKEMYLQAGLVASTSKAFWKAWRETNRDMDRYPFKENDTVNLLVYNQMPGIKLKVLDKEKNYYGCKSLNREAEFYIENDKLMCRGEQVLAYHHAKGQRAGTLPKLNFKNMPFKEDVKQWLYKISAEKK